jgi:ABC-2 type transport system permease protein
MEVTVLQRQGYHASWDRPREETMQRFLRRYPEWSSASVPGDRFSWGWYYAMNQIGDDDAEGAANRYWGTLREREERVHQIAALLPPLSAQLHFSRLAGTDLVSHLEYLQSVRRYHEELKRFFYPVIFREGMVSEVDWSRAPVHRFSEESAAAPVPRSARGACAGWVMGKARRARGAGARFLQRRCWRFSSPQRGTHRDRNGCP